MAVTIKDVARESGVNVSTVSRALNGEYGVHADTREHVVAVAERLRYRPNRVARGLVTGRSHTLALVVSDIRNLFFAEVARGAEDAAYRAGYDLVLCNSDLDAEKQMRYVQSLMEKRVDGILMNSVAALSKKQQEQLSGIGVPIVLLNRDRSAQRLLHHLRRQRSRRRAGGRVPAETRPPQDRAPHRSAPSRQHDGARQGLRGASGGGAQAGETGRAVRQEQLSGRRGTGAETAGAASGHHGGLRGQRHDGVRRHPRADGRGTQDSRRRLGDRLRQRGARQHRASAADHDPPAEVRNRPGRGGDSAAPGGTRRTSGARNIACSACSWWSGNPAWSGRHDESAGIVEVGGLGDGGVASCTRSRTGEAERRRTG